MEDRLYTPAIPSLLLLQRRLAVSRLLAPHERGADVCLAPTIPCGASNRNRQTRRCNTSAARSLEESWADRVTVRARTIQSISRSSCHSFTAHAGIIHRA